MSKKSLVVVLLACLLLNLAMPLGLAGEEKPLSPKLPVVGQPVPDLCLTVPLGLTAILDLGELFPAPAEVSVEVTDGQLAGTVWEYAPDQPGTEWITFTATDAAGSVSQTLVQLDVLAEDALELRLLGENAVASLGYDDPDAPALVWVDSRVDGLHSAEWARAGQVAQLLLEFSKPVYCESSGKIQFSYAQVSGYFEYLGGSGSKTLTFGYQVPEASDLAIDYQVNEASSAPCIVVTGYSLLIDDGIYWSGGQRRGPGNAAPKLYSPESALNTVDLVTSYSLHMDNVPPRVIAISTPRSNGTYGLGDDFYFVVEFSEKVHTGGLSLQLGLNNGGSTGGGGNMAAWPKSDFDLNYDKWAVLYYKPQYNQSTDQLLVNSIISQNQTDQAGNRLAPYAPASDAGKFLSDRQIVIEVPDGVPPTRPYAIATPSEHTDGYLQVLGEHAPTVYYGHRLWPDNQMEIWYYWDQNPNPADATAHWEQVRWTKEGLRRVDNGGRVSGPEGVSLAGAYYLHYAAYTTDGGSCADASGKRDWTAGPFLFDERPPTLSLPWDAEQPMNTRYMVPIRVSDEHSGVANTVEYQWLRAEDGSAYGNLVTTQANGGSAWAMAPAEAGQYWLQVQAVDKAGNANQTTSGTYTIADTPGGAADTLILSATSSWPGGTLAEGLPTTSEYAGMRVSCYFLAAANQLGQCFAAWIPVDHGKPTEQDGRWQMFYDGLAGETSIVEDVDPPLDLASGEYHFYVMAYDQRGNREVVAYQDAEGPIVITIDNTPPSISITPTTDAGFGHSNFVQAEVVLTDNLPITSPDSFWLRSLRLTTYPQDDNYWYELTPEAAFPQPVDGIYPYLKWLVTLPPEYDDDQLFRSIYIDRPAAPLQLAVEVEDGARCAGEASSGPIYLDLVPPNVTVSAPEKVGPNQRLQVGLDLHGEGGVQFSYAIDGGVWKHFEPKEAGELGGPPIAHYHVPVNSAAWSEWQPSSNLLSLPLPALAEGIHQLSLRFRDAFGNEWRYPARVTAPEGWNWENGPPSEDCWTTLDVLWSTTKTFTYDPHLLVSETPPSAKLTYSTLNWTRDDVTVTLQAYDDAGYPVQAVGGNQYIFKENGSHTFSYVDAKGSSRQAIASVHWIDKQAPAAQLFYSVPNGVPTRSSVLVEVYADEPISVSEGDGSYDGLHLFQANGSHAFTVFDRAGNQATVTAEVQNIDRTPPRIEVLYAQPLERGAEVQVTLAGDEPFVVLNEPREIRGSGKNGRHFLSSAKTYSFTENASYTFFIEDEAGNSTSAAVSVTDVRSAEPNVQAALSPESSLITNGSVSITLLSDEPIRMADGQGQPINTLLADENGRYIVHYLDQWNNLFSEAIEVKNIDRQKPEIRFAGPLNLVVRQGSTFGETEAMAGVTAWDNRDGNLTEILVVSYSGEEFGALDTSTPGTHTLTYTVADFAGNNQLVQRDVTVLGDDRLLVYVNGTQPNLAGEVQVRGKSLTVDCFGAGEQCLIRWAEGQQREGYFKYITVNGKDAAGRRYGVQAGDHLQLPLERGGWYTVFVQNYDRQTVCLWVYLEYK